MRQKQRYFIELAYLGTAYHGWQIQHNASSVQAELTRALCTLCDDDITVVGSSRTDAGVHARKQWAHVDLPHQVEVTENLIYRLNALLPHDIVVQQLQVVAPHAHARFSALYRRYHYYLHLQKDPFLNNISYFFPTLVHSEALHTATLILLGVHDFRSFSRVKTNVAHFRCHVTTARWIQHGNTWCFEIQANRFLRGMVRNLVGSLLYVGTGKWTVAKFEEVLAERNRRCAGPAAPAHGLCLMDVGYASTVFSFNQ